jgi:hypothetical protein
VYSPNGRILAGSYSDGVALLDLDVDADDAIQRICAATSNVLERTQWNTYISELPYEPPCANPGHYGLLAP